MAWVNNTAAAVQQTPPTSTPLTARFADPFQVPAAPDAAEPDFQFPNLDHHHHSAGFQFSDLCGGGAGEFDSDGWMESLMGGGDSTESSNLQTDCDAWQTTSEFSHLYPSDPFPSRHSINPPSPSDLNRVLFSEPPTTSTWALPASNHPPLLTLQESKAVTTKDDCAAVGSSSASSPEVSPKAKPIVRALIECARLSESDPENAVKSLIRLQDSVSQGEPLERVSYYLSEALYSRIGETHSSTR